MVLHLSELIITRRSTVPILPFYKDSLVDASGVVVTTTADDLLSKRMFHPMFVELVIPECKQNMTSLRGRLGGPK